MVDVLVFGCWHRCHLFTCFHLTTTPHGRNEKKLFWLHCDCDCSTPRATQKASMGEVTGVRTGLQKTPLQGSLHNITSLFEFFLSFSAGQNPSAFGVTDRSNTGRALLLRCFWQENKVSIAQVRDAEHCFQWTMNDACASCTDRGPEPCPCRLDTVCKCLCTKSPASNLRSASLKRGSKFTGKSPFFCPSEQRTTNSPSRVTSSSWSLILLSISSASVEVSHYIYRSNTVRNKTSLMHQGR